MNKQQAPLVLFDGVCNLCNGAVQFIIRRDPSAKIKFGALQTAAAAALLTRNQLAPDSLETIVFIDDKGEVHQRSGAALRICKHLSGLWPLMQVFLVIPPFIRDPVYNFIARNRYRWFGKRDSCMMPTPDLRSRFLSDDNPGGTS